ncbi:MAG: hypothetical protein ACM3O7_01375, partial [Acidobacteriota bacterium]
MPSRTIGTLSEWTRASLTVTLPRYRPSLFAGVHSLNVPMVRLGTAVGLRQIAERLTDLGFS